MQYALLKRQAQMIHHRPGAHHYFFIFICCCDLAYGVYNDTDYDEISTNGTKYTHAKGYTSITGRLMPIDQLSRVITWKSVYIAFPMLPK